jgi:hypothetical protein
MHRDIPLGPDQHRIQPRSLLGRCKESGNDLVGAGGKPCLDLFRLVGSSECSDRYNGRESVALEAPHQSLADCPRTIAVNKEQAGVATKHDGLDFGWLAEGQ